MWLAGGARIKVASHAPINTLHTRLPPQPTCTHRCSAGGHCTQPGTPAPPETQGWGPHSRSLPSRQGSLQVAKRICI